MTERYHKTDPMSDLISDDYRMLQLISRFGITLGFGDKSVADTCRASGVDTATFLSVVNYIKDGAHSHVEERADEVSLPALMRYLKNSHGYFVDYRLPYIRRQLIEAVAERIASMVLREYPRVQCVDVTVHKPSAPIPGDFRDVAVAITRERA